MAITGKTGNGLNVHDNRYIEVLSPKGKRPGVYRDVSQSIELYKHRKRLAERKAKLISVVQPEDLETVAAQL